MPFGGPEPNTQLFKHLQKILIAKMHSDWTLSDILGNALINMYVMLRFEWWILMKRFCYKQLFSYSSFFTYINWQHVMKRNGCFFVPAPHVGVIYLFSADSAPCIFVNIGELDSYYQEAGQNLEFEH